jgi:putative flippase GtrA
MSVFHYIDEVIVWFISLFFKADHHKRALHQFIKFGMIGVINTSIDFAIYVLLTRSIDFFSQYIYLANALSFSSAVIFSYFANRRWTFAVTHKPKVKEAMKFYVASGIGFVLNSTILYIGVHFLGMYDLIAKIIATIVTIFWNFLASKFWVFGAKQKST